MLQYNNYRPKTKNTIETDIIKKELLMKNTLKIALDKLKNPYIWLVTLADVFLVLFLPVMIFGALGRELEKGVIFLLAVLVIGVMMLFRLLVVRCYRRYVDDYNARRWERVMKKTWFEKFLYKTDHAYDQMSIIRAIGSMELGNEEAFLYYIDRVTHPVYDSYKHFWMMVYAVMNDNEELLAENDELFAEDVGKVKDNYMPLRDMLIKSYRGVALTAEEKRFVNEKVTLNVLRRLLTTENSSDSSASEAMQSADEMKVDTEEVGSCNDVKTNDIVEDEASIGTDEEINDSTADKASIGTDEKMSDITAEETSISTD